MDQQYPSWANDEIMRDYYENYWGRPVHDEDQLFEMFSGGPVLGDCLEKAAGL